jgi:hypothetical protein
VATNIAAPPNVQSRDRWTGIAVSTVLAGGEGGGRRTDFPGKSRLLRHPRRNTFFRCGRAWSLQREGPGNEMRGVAAQWGKIPGDGF